jgi:hypothetical protein
LDREDGTHERKVWDGMKKRIAVAKRYAKLLSRLVVGITLTLASGLAPIEAPALAESTAMDANAPVVRDGAVEAPTDEEAALFDLLEEEAGQSTEDATGSAVRTWQSACTAAPHGSVCIYVWGFGDDVDHVRVVRMKTSQICPWQAAMYIVDPSGRLIERQWSPIHDGCVSRQASYDFDPRRGLYPTGSDVCGAFYEDGVKQGGSPCVSLPLH